MTSGVWWKFNWVIQNGIMKFSKKMFLLKFIVAAILDE